MSSLFCTGSGPRDGLREPGSSGSTSWGRCCVVVVVGIVVVGIVWCRPLVQAGIRVMRVGKWARASWGRARDDGDRRLVVVIVNIQDELTRVSG